MDGIIFGSLAWILGDSATEVVASYFGIELEEDLAWYHYLLIIIACLAAFLMTMVVLARYVWPPILGFLAPAVAPVAKILAGGK